MTPAARDPATRSSLMRCTRRLDQVRRGAALLRRKRQSLVEELFARATRAVTSREAIEAQARRAWESLWIALSSSGADGLKPLGWPAREVDVELQTTDLWGIRAVTLSNRSPLARSLAARAVCPAPGEGADHEAARQFEALIEQVLDAAPREHAMRRLSEALSHTTRLVNTLEQRIAVRLAANVTEIRRTLSEREREEQHRVKRLLARRERT